MKKMFILIVGLVVLITIGSADLYQIKTFIFNGVLIVLICLFLFPSLRFLAGALTEWTKE